MENKEKTQDITYAGFSTSVGPKGPEIPIIGSSLAISIGNLTKNDSYSAYEAALDELKECGFNGVIEKIDRSGDYLKNLLIKANAKNLYVIVSSDILKPSKTTTTENYEEKINNFIALCSNTPGCGGVYLKDEPKWSELNADKSLISTLPWLYNFVNSKIGDDRITMVNLVGAPDEKRMDMTSKELPKEEVWKELTEEEKKDIKYNIYLEAFANITVNGNRPYLWSYDLYPIKEDNYLLKKNYFIEIGDNHNLNKLSLPNNGEISVIYRRFYKDLEEFHNMTQTYGGVFWTYIQSMEFMASSNYRPLALEQYLRFVIFSSLAMGCQGIMYWTYHQRNNQNTELYLSAPIDRDDNRTPVWYYAKKVNAEIRKFNHVFRNTQLVNWGHVGEIYECCKLLESSIGCVSKVSINRNIAGYSYTGVLITSIRTGDSDYIVIVSHDVCYPQKITINFRSGYTIHELYRTDVEGSEGTLIPTNTTSIERVLLPGDYLIYKYQIKLVIDPINPPTPNPNPNPGPVSIS